MILCTISINVHWASVCTCICTCTFSSFTSLLFFFIVNLEEKHTFKSNQKVSFSV